MKKFICPSCSAISSFSGERPVCRTCGSRMAPIEGCFHVSVPDRPGALAEFLKGLADETINVTALRIVGRREGRAYVLFSVDKSDAAARIPGVRRAEDVDDLGAVAADG